MGYQGSTELPPPRWTATAKSRLQSFYRLINPHSLKDWEKVADAVFNSLSSWKHNQRKWSVDEIKMQVAKMKLESPKIANATKTPKNSVVKRIVRSANKLPQKGTILREKLKDELMQQIFVRSRGNDTQPEITNKMAGLEELLHEQLVSEAMQGCPSNVDSVDVKTPSKRTFYPTSKYASRSKSQIDSVGHKFAMPNHSMHYAYRYRAQQICRNFGIKKTENVDGEDE